MDKRMTFKSVRKRFNDNLWRGQHKKMSLLLLVDLADIMKVTYDELYSDSADAFDYLLESFSWGDYSSMRLKGSLRTPENQVFMAGYRKLGKLMSEILEYANDERHDALAYDEELRSEVDNDDDDDYDYHGGEYQWEIDYGKDGKYGKAIWKDVKEQTFKKYRSKLLKAMWFAYARTWRETVNRYKRELRQAR